MERATFRFAASYSIPCTPHNALPAILVSYFMEIYKSFCIYRRWFLRFASHYDVPFKTKLVASLVCPLQLQIL